MTEPPEEKPHTNTTEGSTKGETNNCEAQSSPPPNKPSDREKDKANQKWWCTNDLPMLVVTTLGVVVVAFYTCGTYQQLEVMKGQLQIAINSSVPTLHVYEAGLYVEAPGGGIKAITDKQLPDSGIFGFNAQNIGKIPSRLISEQIGWIVARKLPSVRPPFTVYRTDNQTIAASDGGNSSVRSFHFFVDRACFSEKDKSDLAAATNDGVHTFVWGALTYADWAGKPIEVGFAFISGNIDKTVFVSTESLNPPPGYIYGARTASKSEAEQRDEQVRCIPR